MMRFKKNYVLSFLICICIPISTHANELKYLEKRDIEKNQEKLVGILFSNFSGISSSDDIFTFIFKEGVRARLDAQEKKRALGYAYTYILGAPLKKQKHRNAIKVARTSGFQGIIWGETNAYKYKKKFDGIAIFPHFSYAGDYKDYRNSLGRYDRKLENWIVEFNGKTLKVPPPSNFIDLPPYLISNNLLRLIEKNKLCAKSQRNNKCINITKLPPNKITAINFDTGRVKYKLFDGKIYTSFLPKEILISQEAISYVALFINYTRGHWSNSIELANEVIKGDNSSSQMVRDALLFKSAAMFRSGNDGSSPLRIAKKNFPFSPEVSRYKVVSTYQALKAGRINFSEFENVVKSEKNLLGTEWMLKNELLSY